jgi:hypothetical protein
LPGVSGGVGPEGQLEKSWARLRSLPAPRTLQAKEVPADILEEEVPWAWQDPAVLDWAGGYMLHTASDSGEARVDVSTKMTGERWYDDDGVGMITFVVGDADEFAECGDGYLDSVWGAVDLADGGKAKPGRTGVLAQRPDAVFDLDGDGRLDVLVTGASWQPDQILLGTDDGFALAATLDPVPFFGCPC